MTDIRCSSGSEQPRLSPDMVLQEARSLVAHLNSLNKPYSSGVVADCIATIENLVSRLPSAAQGAAGCGAMIEACAKIAEPWAGFWLDEYSTDADRAVVDVRKEIAAKIRALVVSSTVRGSGWRSDCPACVASKFTCDEHYSAPSVTSTHHQDAAK